MTFQIDISGLVQGVGFRPFVYRLATQYKLKGYVTNNTHGVKIVISCLKKEFEVFIEALKKSAPPLSKIEEIQIEKLHKKEKFEHFTIVKSDNSSNFSAQISPDLALCKECLAEFHDRDNRRYHYPFISCVNCGPRYSILRQIPYERENISMSKFIMCSECKEEYENPLSRRYHSETIACYKCGMKLSLIDKNAKCVSQGNEIEQFVNALERGSIVALKGVGGYHLICDSTNKKSIEKLRKLKRRLKKPFAIMVKNLEHAEEIAIINRAERELLDSSYKPIVLLYKKESYNLSDLIAPDINQVGIMLAYTPLHHLILEKFSKPIVVTSANISGESIAKSREEILIVSTMWDLCLDNDREIENYCDDSVAFVEDEDVYMLRNARGYAPKYFYVKNIRNKKALALGANQKSTIAILNQNKIIISPYLGELNSLGSLERYKENIERFQSLYNFQSKLIAHDKHSKYESTKYAYELHKKEKSELLGLQHHYMHSLASMGINDLEGEVLAVSFDGLGYGDDGKLWGGEFFLCDMNKYERVAHIQEFKLLGADKAIREPRRVAFGILVDMYGKDALELKNCVTSSFSAIELQTLYTAHQKNINSPITTSMGRVFDAVASMLDIVQVSSYEGESGLSLESYYDMSIKESYEYSMQGKSIVLYTMFKALLEEQDKQVAVSRFFNTIVKIIAEMKQHFKQPLVVSGGVFQNRILLRLLKAKIADIYLPQEFVSNDGAIAYGQAIAASASS